MISGGKTGDKISTCPLVFTSGFWKGRVILPKALVLQDECYNLQVKLASSEWQEVFSSRFH